MSATLAQRFHSLCAGVLRSTAAVHRQTGDAQLIHTGAALSAGYSRPEGPRSWLRYNKVVYEPQTADEAPRPAVSARSPRF